jgi:hypothetical protein
LLVPPVLDFIKRLSQIREQIKKSEEIVSYPSFNLSIRCSVYIL